MGDQRSFSLGPADIYIETEQGSGDKEAQLRVSDHPAYLHVPSLICAGCACGLQGKSVTSLCLRGIAMQASLPEFHRYTAFGGRSAAQRTNKHKQEQLKDALSKP